MVKKGIYADVELVGELVRNYYEKNIKLPAFRVVPVKGRFGIVTSRDLSILFAYKICDLPTNRYVEE